MSDRSLRLIVLAGCLTLACLSSLPAEAEVDFPPPTIEVPPGFTVELVARPPLA